MKYREFSKKKQLFCFDELLKQQQMSINNLILFLQNCQNQDIYFVELIN
jgi:hypothetical protein